MTRTNLAGCHREASRSPLGRYLPRRCDGCGGRVKAEFSGAFCEDCGLERRNDANVRNVA